MRGRNSLTLQERRMLSLLRKSNGWVRSSDLAQALGFRSLKRYQMRLLRNMVEKDLIEVRPPFNAMRGRMPCEYRAQGKQEPEILTPRTCQLLKALRVSCCWLTREELAQMMGKAQLTSHDLNLLRELKAQGLLTVRSGHFREFGLSTYEFREKGGDNGKSSV